MAPINVTTSSEKVTAAVSEDKVTATVAAGSPVSATVTAGFGATGPQGPSGVVNVTAPITNAGTTAAANIGISLGEGLSVSSGSLRVTPGTYATLVDGTVPSNLLPSYVDDVLEFSNVASLPTTGETGKIYVALNTGKIYRWSGSAYFEISTPPANTDAVPEGSSNLYFTNARARNSFGTGTTGQVVAWSGSEWTAGTVVIASVTGLQTALDGKAASSHNHDASAINAGTLAADRLPLASANTRGAVRIGSGISIDGNGVISVSVPSLDWGSITDKPAVLDGGYLAIDGSGFLCVRSLNVAKPVKVETNAGSYGGLYLYSLEFVGEGEGAGILFGDSTRQNTAWPGSLSYNDLDDLPSLFDGSYASLSNVPSTFTPASHAHGNLSNDGLVNGNTTSGQIVVTTTGGALTTAATIASSAVSGLGGAATLNVGTTAGTVAAGDHTHAQLHDRSHAITSTSDHTATAWRVFYTDASGAITELALGAAGKVLQSNGATAAPTWETASGGDTVSIDTTAADILSATSGAISADDPGADRLVFWDDSASKLTHLAVGSGLSISGTTITAAVSPTVASPSQITSNQNDYAGATGDINRISSDAARDITGIAAGTDGQAILLLNVGSNNITLKHQSASSTAANRIVVPWGGDCVIPADASAALVYDNTTARWRVI